MTERRKCPDDGRCHDDCERGHCFRVKYCASLSGFADAWSEEIRAAEARGELAEQFSSEDLT